MNSTLFAGLVAGVALVTGWTFEASAQTTKQSPYFYNEVKVLCIGINQYPRAGIGDLRKAEADAKLFGETLRKLFGYEPVYLLGAEATKTRIESAVKTIGNQLGKDDALIIYFACHGVVIERSHMVQNVSVPTLEGYLLPHNANINVDDPNSESWDKTSLKMFAFVETLDELAAEHVLLVADSCCSGFLTTRGILDVAWQVNLLKKPSRQIVAATTKEESAQEGVFTPELLKVLEAYSKKIEAASVTDVFDEVVKPVTSVSQRRMTPRMSHFGNRDGEFVFFPLALPKEDINLVRREVDKERSAESTRLPGATGRGVLNAMARRANERSGLKTDIATVAAAIVAPDYWYGTKAAEKTEQWRKIRERLQKNAARNDPLAMAGLHLCFARGLGEAEQRPDLDLAYRWAVAANQVQGASGIGKYLLGRCYRSGIGVEKNEAAAERLYSESAKDGFILAEIGVAQRTLLNSPSADEAKIAIRAVEKGVDQKLAVAMNFLGNVYGTGKIAGIPGDITKAITLFEDAVKLGAFQRTVVLYEAYSEVGKPGLPPRDLSKAEAYLREGAEEGIAAAQFWLGDEYLRAGENSLLRLPKNPREGVKWLELAGKQKYGRALSRLGRVYGLGEANGIPIDFDKARRYVEEAVAQNDAEGLILKGGWHLGEGGPFELSEKKAFSCFERAAKQNNAGGCEGLGRCYEGGIGIVIAKQFQKPNALHDKSYLAYHWFMKAMEYGGTEYANERLKYFRGIWGLEKRGVPFGRGFELEPSEVMRKWENTLPDTAAEFKRKYRQ